MPPERQCTATNKNLGVRCKNWTVAGTNVCKRHGGFAPHVRAAGRRRVVEALVRKEAEGILAKQGITPIEDPLDELMKLGGEVTAYREIFRSQVDKLLARGDIRYDNMQGEQLRAEVALWERTAEKCLKVYSEIVRLGIAERQVRIREAEVVLMAQAIRNILARLDLTPAQKSMAGQVVSEELRAIEAPKKD